MRSVYLDYAAATPLDGRVKKAMEPFLSKEFGNPSSIHSYGIRAKKALEQARGSIAGHLGAVAKEIVFTSGGTESNTMALLGVANAYRVYGKHIIVSSTEHPSILESCKYLEKHGYKVTYLPVDQSGYIRLEELKKALTSDTILVSIVYAQNETGVTQPLRDISKIVRRIKDTSSHRLPFLHTDASQAVGVCDLSVDRLGVDLMTLHASKIYGPRGTGLLYVRSGVHLQPILYGGGQQDAIRPGTENVVGAVGFAKALDLAEKMSVKEIRRFTRLRDMMTTRLQKEIPGIRINSIPEGLPTIVHISISDIDGEAAVMYLDARGIAASTGSACSSVARKKSHILEAIGLLPNEIKGSLRFSLGRWTRTQDIDYTIDTLKKVITRLHQ
ncbi:MAG: cysteine desulfurase family protein [bacterium]|nr:cysteine desulfurase family protein [bacterium]